MAEPNDLLPLEDCFQRLKSINHSIKHLKDISEIYTGAVGLLCHLKKEQTVLYRKAKSKESCPSLNQMPAMLAVISDARLFASLLRCLKIPPLDGGTEAASSASSARRSISQPSHHNPRSNIAGRKRTMSFGNEGSTKLAKTGSTSSPMVSKQRMMIDLNNTRKNGEAMTLPIQLIASSILYASLQHLDHWPAPLVHAYAEDTFGPRLWVDRKECQLLVSNLKLSHDKNALIENDAIDDKDELKNHAQQVAIYYEKLMMKIPEEVPLPHTRGGSIMRSISQASAVEPAYLGDSDSGDEEIVEVSMGKVIIETPTSMKVDDSSSSGEEEIIDMDDNTASNGQISVLQRNPYPIQPKEINLERIRQRYFGRNKDSAFVGVANALAERLAIKSKQNSRLLQTLPNFVTIPGVRALTAKNLERWLQSPALSGAARLLFSSTVEHLQDRDPPLPDDLDAIDAILGMQLKTNQLNMHIGNISQIAKGISVPAVSRHIYTKLLFKEIQDMDNTSQLQNNKESEYMQMVSTVHGALSNNLSNDGLAAAILELLKKPANSSPPTRQERNQLVRKIRLLLRRLFGILGSQFNGCGLVQSFLTFDKDKKSRTLLDEEDKGRIMLECVTLHVPNPPDDPGLIRGKNMKKFQKATECSNGISSEDLTKLKKVLLRARKLLLKWCVIDLFPLFQSEKNSKLNTNKMKRANKKKKKDIGAGAANYSSILDKDATLNEDSSCPNVMKCVLFMVEPESSTMQEFLYPEGPPQQGDSTWNEEIYRLKQCYKYGADLDDQMISIVLKSSPVLDEGVMSSMALNLIEHLFECCKKERHAELRLKDANIIWKIYDLVEYFPKEILGQNSVNTPNNTNNAVDDDDQFADAEDDVMDINQQSGSCIMNGKPKESIPRLAYPGLWWRVASLALVMTGASPVEIGSTLAEHHPTIHELVKMVTSGRYRFPTVDCDDMKREDMKKEETRMRTKESEVAELLFFPPKPKPKEVEKPTNHHHGSRVSIRQKQKQERAMQRKREKLAAEALAAEHKRKKMLKAAQKTIMIWDPKGPARKPPKESVNLILSVERMFDLSNNFQKCVEPDLILQALGGTSRGAIERAYDWLIPVVSSIPSIISRLPPSASCFLLLRVYGAEGERNSELRELSAPLLDHVQKTTTGSYGQENAINAANLLLTDVADKKPALRRCARRVLEEALSDVNQSIEDRSFDAVKCTWLHSLLHLEHSNALLPDAIKHISDALSYERGQVLRALILSLHRYIDYATRNQIKGTWKFSTYICKLISTRHNICSEAIDRFPDVRCLSIETVHETFLKFLNQIEIQEENAELATAQFKSCRSNKDSTVSLIRLPLSLLQSTCVLLSIWKERGDDEADDEIDTSKDLISELTDILMVPCNSPGSISLEVDCLEGIASAKITTSGYPAVSIEEWVMLAKSRTDDIARRAALSAPSKFLPRLLLCSGLPKSSLLTMIDRLGKLGEKSQNEHQVYRDLLMPSAAADWGFGRLGTRREIARKLLGRMSAYISMTGETVATLSKELSFTFMLWLAEESQPPERYRKGRPLKKAIKAGLSLGIARKLRDAESILENIDKMHEVTAVQYPISDDVSILFKDCPADSENVISEVAKTDVKDFIRKCLSHNDSDTLESWIKSTFFSAKKVVEKEEEINQCTVATILLEESHQAETSNTEWNRAVERWTPILSTTNATPELWRALFLQSNSELDIESIISACCLTWCPFNSAACRDWLLSSSPNLAAFDLQGVVNFILQTSGQKTPHAHFLKQERKVTLSLFEEKEIVDRVISIAFECAKQAGQVINRRNDIAAWLQLLLLVAQAGKRQTNHLINTLLLEVEEAKHGGLRMLMGEAILRIYSYFPFHVNLGNPKLRELLVDTSKSIDWRRWRTPIDDTLNDMLGGLKQNPSQRLVQGIVELSKGHPLILLRKLEIMASILESDALVNNAKGASRIRIQAENIEGPLLSTYNEGKAKVIVQHWGYSYTDPLWTSFIDILLSVPRGVLFSCGNGMGLDALLCVYVRLFWVQSQLIIREQKVMRLKARFSDFITAFEKDPDWNKWLASFVPGINGNVRKILVQCDLLTADQAIENIRSQAK